MAISMYSDLGQEIVAGNDIYGGSDRLLSQVLPKTGVVVKLVILPVLVLLSGVITFCDRSDCLIPLQTGKHN